MRAIQARTSGKPGASNYTQIAGSVGGGLSLERVSASLLCSCS